MDNNSQQRKKKRRNRSKTRKKDSGPRLFSDFGSIAHGLLTTGYSHDQKLSISRNSWNGVIITSNTVKHGKQLTTGIGARYTYKNASIDVNIGSKPSISTTLTLGGKILPSTNMKASLKLPDYSSSRLNIKFEHFSRNAALSISLGLKESPDIMLSATIGTPSIAFGMESKYKIASHSFTQYDAGISVTKRSFNASIILAERCDLLRLAYVHHFGHSRKISSAAEFTRRLSKTKNSFAVGVSCSVDDRTTVKAKVSNRGKLQALLRYKIKPKLCINISNEFDTKALNKIPRIGLAIVLML